MSQFTNQILSEKDSRFTPKANLTDKANFGRHMFIEQDGNITEVVRLNVLDDRDREEIIGFHFSQQYAKFHYGDQEEQPQFYVIGRDCPWDFEYVMHDGTNFFIEICRIADKNLLKAMKAENDVMMLLGKSKLKGYEVLKIERHFPGTLPKELVQRVQTKADKQNIFPIDELNSPSRMFLRPPMMPKLNLVNEIQTAISKKVAKRHKGKESTIILLDNLTTHADPKHFFDAVKDLQDYLDEVPFPSIWLYTGYYSDDNGYNCEYSLVPIKLSEREVKTLETGQT